MIPRGCFMYICVICLTKFTNLLSKGSNRGNFLLYFQFASAAVALLASSPFLVFGCYKVLSYILVYLKHVYVGR